MLIAGNASAAAPAEGAASAPEAAAFTSKTGIFDVEAMMALGRIGGATAGPDGKVLYSVARVDVAANKTTSRLYTIDIDGSAPAAPLGDLTGCADAVWMADGQHIAYIHADDNGTPQLWVMNNDGTGARCISSLEKGVNGFLFSPDGKQVVLIGNVKYARKASDIYADLPKATGRVIDDLMYKHWNEWVDEIPHPFVADFDGQGALTNVRDIMIGEPFESPMKPFGGIESFAWTPDSKGLIYVSRKKTGVEYAISTNSDLYLYNLADNSTRNLTEGMMGYDTCPVFSPDGKYLTWLSMELDGYEADKNRLFMMDWATGAKTDLTAEWDYTVEQFAWRPDGKAIYLSCYHNGVQPIFSLDVKTHRVSEVLRELADFHSLAPLDNKTLLCMRHSMTAPDEVFVVSIDKKGQGKARQLTEVNNAILAQIEMPTVKEEWVPTTDGKKMLTWIVYPPRFDATKQYPSILYCQGGPQSAVSQFWSYRWNFALMSSNGYIMVAPNRRGVPGFGTEWEEQISKDYPGQNMQDYLAAADWAKANVRGLDPDRMGCTGASYGGFSTYWLAGNHDKRFKAFFAHAGIFNTVQQYLETEEMWFANWDMGGAYWEKDNAAAQRTFAASPHLFVDNWDTPIMVSHGEYDFRILASQGMAAFNAAKLRGIPAEMVIFPDECHWIQKPQNAVLWHRLFKRWFDRWLKDEK